MYYLFYFLLCAAFVFSMALLMALIEKLPIVNKLTNLFLNEED